MNLLRIAARVAAGFGESPLQEGAPAAGSAPTPTVSKAGGDMNDPVTQALSKAFDRVLAVRTKAESTGDDSIYSQDIPLGSGEDLFPGEGLEEMSWSLEFAGDWDPPNSVVRLQSVLGHDAETVMEFSVQACEDSREEYLASATEALKADAEGGKAMVAEQEAV